MSRPALEVADIFRGHGPAWRKANAGHVSLGQLKVMSAIENCRTAALGGHVARCENEKCNPHHHLCRSRRTGNARSSCWQRLQASRIDRLSALGASPICALGYSLQGGFNLVDFGSLSLAYNFECFLIFKFNGLVLGISREQFV
jgi:hypothetical protein